MPQEYEIIQFKKGDFQDNHGNFWCNVALRGLSEPVMIVVKDPTKYKDGDKIYGRITQETSKAGKSYQRFRREPRPDENTPSHGSRSYTPRDDAAIRAQFSIKTAVELLKTPEANVAEDTIEHWAKVFYKMVDRVKDSDKPVAISKVEQVVEQVFDVPAEESDMKSLMDSIPF
jgi:hypothetical protein